MNEAKRITIGDITHGVVRTTLFNILDILKDPDAYVSSEVDKMILVMQDESAAGGLLRFFIGIDEKKEKYYFVVEDDETSKDEYVKEDESLLEAFIRILDENIVSSLYDLCSIN